MKRCPICNESPVWHLGRNVSWKRRGDHFMFCGCKHAVAFARDVDFVDVADRNAFEARWDAEAERLFAIYTANWTDPQRVSYRVRVFDVEVPNELPL